MGEESGRGEEVDGIAEGEEEEPASQEEEVEEELTWVSAAVQRRPPFFFFSFFFSSPTALCCLQLCIMFARNSDEVSGFDSHHPCRFSHHLLRLPFTHLVWCEMQMSSIN